MEQRFAYLARGQVHLKDGTGPARRVESQFAEQVRDRAREAAQRNSWKHQGRENPFQAALWGGKGERDPSAISAQVTGLSRARDGSLLFTQETDGVAGLFSLSRSSDGKDEEKRLFHGTEWKVHQPAAHPVVDLVACTVMHPTTGTSNIAVLSGEGSRLQEITEGDSIDARPSWVSALSLEIVFETAGIGRDSAGNFMEVAPSSIQRLDLKSGEMVTLAESPDQDLCGPRMLPDGTLLYIQRPRLRSAKPHPGKVLLSILMIPFRLVRAIFGFLEFFTIKYTGKPLSQSGGVGQKQADLKRMMIWGNVTAAQRELARAQTEPDETPLRVPSSWQLMRLRPGGKPESVATSVATFDVGLDGSVLFSDGVQLTLISPAGERTAVGEDHQIEQVLLLSETSVELEKLRLESESGNGTDAAN